MDQLSQALKLGAQPMQSAYSRLHGPTLKNISRKNRLYLYGVDILTEFSETARGGSGACQGRKPTLWRRLCDWRRDRRSVSTRPSLYPGLRNNLMRLPWRSRQSNRTRINMCRMSYKSKEIVGRNSKSLRQKGENNGRFTESPLHCLLLGRQAVKSRCSRCSRCPRWLKKSSAIALAVKATCIRQ